MSIECDLLVIGAGPGGYVAAIRAAQLGMSVVVVDKQDRLGGTCLNVGCIPSKALLHASQKFYDTKHNLNSFGIFADDIRLDLQKLMAYKNETVDNLTRGIGFLFKKNNIQFLQGVAEFQSANEIIISSDKEKKTILGKNILIATGSVPSYPKDIKIDEKQIVSSTGVLSLKKVPKHLAVIGAGYIGLEMASVWSKLGSSVTIIEYAKQILPNLDSEVSQFLQRNLQKDNFSFRLNQKVLKIEKSPKKVILHVQNNQENSSIPHFMECDVVLVSTGRKPLTHTLNLDKANIECNTQGFIKVNEYFQTNISNVYAIGDVIGGAMLAHKASHEGIAVAEILNGQAGSVNYKTIPSVVYTHPEVACVGKTEEELKQSDIDYKAGKFPFLANSRSKTIKEATGFVKILADARTDTVLGAHIVGCDAGNLISEIVTAMEFCASSEDIARICHPHPTQSEAIMEAAWATFSKPLHV